MPFDKEVRGISLTEFCIPAYSLTRSYKQNSISSEGMLLQGPRNMSCMQGFVFVLAHIKLIQSIEIILETRHSRNQ